MKGKFNCLMLLAVIFFGCKREIENVDVLQKPETRMSSNMTQTISSVSDVFAHGADIGWLSRMEARGQKFYNKNGVQDDCLQILKDQGINAIRLRVWVNPADGFCNKEDVTAMAIRAKAKGMRLMIDFHYSDNWADPAKQNKPAAWANHTFSQLLTAVYDHTYDVLDTLNSHGITAEWVQVGNEIIKGMLWPDGHTNDYSKLAQLINQGYAAAKAVNVNSKVIVHISGGENSNQSVSFFNNLTANGGNFDMIGLSYYPYYAGKTYAQLNGSLTGTMNSLVSNFNKPVMVVETGNEYTEALATYNGLNDCINRISALAGGKGQGLFYWEPQAYMSWSGYKLNAFDNTTKSPSLGMDAFLYNPSSNLITNYDFEASGPQTSNVTGWKAWTDNNANSIKTESGGYTRVQRLTHWKATSYKALSYQEVTGIPNGTYMLTAWVKRGSGQTTCQMYAKGFGGAEKNIALPVTSTWTQITINDIEVTNNKVEVGLWSVANAGNWASIDNIHLQPQL